MPLKTEPLEEPTINLTSMLDVVMLLIVFFMVGTKFSEEERQIGIQVPTTSETLAMSGQPDEIVVNVTIDGKVTVRAEAHTIESLKSLLVAAREVFPGQAVLIRGDGRGEYQAVMDVISACTSAGIKSVKLANAPISKGS